VRYSKIRFLCVFYECVLQQKSPKPNDDSKVLCEPPLWLNRFRILSTNYRRNVFFAGDNTSVSKNRFPECYQVGREDVCGKMCVCVMFGFLFSYLQMKVVVLKMKPKKKKYVVEKELWVYQLLNSKRNWDDLMKTKGINIPTIMYGDNFNTY